MKCNKCGATNKVESQFCGNCGAKLEASVLNKEQNLSTNSIKSAPSNIFQKIRQKLSSPQIAVICSSAVVIIAVVTTIAIAFTNKKPKEIDEPTEDSYAYGTEETTDDFTYESKISDDYILLAEGTDEKGNSYELVGDEKESYEGISLEIGVIKNNEWLKNLTSDMPFIAEDGTIKHGINFEDGEYRYVGYGCFEYYIEYDKEEYKSKKYFCFYNSENSKHCDYDSLVNYLPERLTYKDGDYSKIIWPRNSFNEEGLPYTPDHFFIDSKMILGCTRECEAIILDKDSMKFSSISLPIDEIETCCQVSDGLFFISNRYISDLVNFAKDSNIKQYICDMKGNIVIDLSKYSILYDRISDDGTSYYASENHLEIYFKNGRATVPIINNNGTEYELVIDVKGNVISSDES